MTTINVKAEARSAREVLAGSRATVESALRAAVDGLLPSMLRIDGYHLCEASPGFICVPEAREPRDREELSG